MVCFRPSLGCDLYSSSFQIYARGGWLYSHVLILHLFSFWCVSVIAKCVTWPQCRNVPPARWGHTGVDRVRSSVICDDLEVSHWSFALRGTRWETQFIHLVLSAEHDRVYGDQGVDRQDLLIYRLMGRWTDRRSVMNALSDRTDSIMSLFVGTAILLMEANGLWHSVMRRWNTRKLFWSSVFYYPDLQHKENWKISEKIKGLDPESHLYSHKWTDSEVRGTIRNSLHHFHFC